MVTVERTVSVRRPMKDVLAYLEDFARAEEWDPGTQRCTRIDDGPLGEGAQWHNVSRFRGRETELTYCLVRRQERRLTFEGNNKTAQSVDDMFFEEVSEGTLVTYRATIRFKGLAVLAGPFLRREFERLGDEVAVLMPQAVEASG